MNLVGCNVIHAKFGEGKIEDLSDEIMTVNFPEGKKKFVYPDAFSKFLVLRDKEKQKEVINYYKKEIKKNKVKNQVKQQIQMKISKLHSIKSSPQSQAVFNYEQESIAEIAKENKVFTGYYMSGESKGQPKIPTRLGPNSACLITYVPKDKKEKDRLVAGIFMVKDSFYGEKCKDGQIELHEKYNFLIPEDKRFGYWEYAELKDKEPAWGKVAFKYFKNTSLRKILKRTVDIFKGTDQEKEVYELYNYYCILNHFQSDNGN